MILLISLLENISNLHDTKNSNSDGDIPQSPIQKSNLRNSSQKHVKRDIIFFIMFSFTLPGIVSENQCLPITRSSLLQSSFF